MTVITGKNATRPPMTPPPSRKWSPRRVALVAGLVIAVGGTVAAGLMVRQRQHARLPELLRARASAAGMVVKFGGVQATAWRATVQAVQVEFARAAGVKAVADTAILHPGSADRPEIAVEHLTLTVSAGASGRIR